MSGTILIADYEALDVVLLCHAALAQDSPELPEYYLNQILNRMFAFLTAEQKQESKSTLLRRSICHQLPRLKLQND